ncbi:hypothetical protein J8L98_10650 [Pseudoalteromonas sp. MMG013]|uniref:hypothetical protein n=1 Tax=Pseudoalteromonas sp. MMG013 TaxID=2822687 RepID=UPI001B396FB5|nr:hypothetical protein [Pseudoalteromonas sp. MMG013]
MSQHQDLACWKEIGVLARFRQLHMGDVVSVRFYTSTGEVKALCVQLVIGYHSQCAAHAWSSELANTINVHVPLVRVNQINTQGRGKLPVMAHTDSGIIACKVEFKCKVQPKKPAHSIPAYDYIFPKEQQTYQQGTRVWHEKSQRCYRCKPWPFTEYCRNGAAQFEPNEGALWQVAWEAI